MKLANLIPKFVSVSWVYSVRKHRMWTRCGLSEQHLRNTFLGCFILHIQHFSERQELHKKYVLESARALRGGERGSVAPVLVYKDVFYSHWLFCLSYNKLLGNQDKFYDAHESRYNFPVCLPYSWEE